MIWLEQWCVRCGEAEGMRRGRTFNTQATRLGRSRSGHQPFGSARTRMAHGGHGELAEGERAF